MAIRLVRLILVIAGLSLFLASCQERQTSLPDTLKIGILPDQNTATIIELYQPLIIYLRNELDVDINLVAASNYEELLDMFVNNKIDLANFGALTYLQAKNQIPVKTVVMRDIDARFTSYFIVGKDLDYKSLTETKGLSLAFGSKLSTSGHMMPRYFLIEQEIQPENFFSSITYSGKHDKTVQLVAENKADVGAVNAQIYDKLLIENNQFAQQTRFIWETPPYIDYMWAIQNHYSNETVAKVRDAFLDLSYNNPQHQIILDNLGCKGFLPVVDEDFREIENLARSTGLLQ